MNASQKLRIVFAGTPEFAEQALRLLIDSGHHVVAVYTQPDRPAGRGKKLQPSAVKTLALENDLAVFQPVNFKDQKDRDTLAALNADLMVVVAYGLILPQAVLDTPKHGCINIHASILPRWRGAAPIHRAIESGDTTSGVTVMQMNAGLDTGDMLSVYSCHIDSRDTTASLHDKLIDVGKPALLETLKRIAGGTLEPTAQDDRQATYAHKIEKAEALVDWQQDALTLDRKIRAFYPFPVSYSLLDGKRIKLHRAFVLEQHSQGTAGQIIESSNLGIDVQTGHGSIRIEQLQMPGKKVLPCADILRGHADLFKPGQVFQSPETGELN